MKDMFSIDEVYRACLTGFLSFKEIISIVTIGANDGRIGDPSFSFAQQYSNRTSMLLIEPQKDLIPFLENNYSFHPLHKIYNGAIAPSGLITLYSIRREFWSQVQPPYASSDWPLYRAPTGITSTLREHVERWIQSFSDLNPEEIIEASEVPCTTLSSLLAELNIPHHVDVLQIDTEGTDDIVLSACNIDETQPSVIIMETGHLGVEREMELVANLKRKGYSSMLTKMNSLFIREILV